MKQYYRIMLGQACKHANECVDGGFIGTDFGIDQDLKDDLPADWREFNKKFIPIYQEIRPDKKNRAAGLACRFLWTVSKELQIGDIVLCPKGDGSYAVGEVSSDYYYEPNGVLPHRRNVKWYPTLLPRSDMSQPLKNSSGSIGTCCKLTKFAVEIEELIAGDSLDETVQDLSVFALEEHLEAFLVANWSNTELGQNYDIFVEDGEVAGQQYQTDTGPIDILAQSKDKKEYLVIELKKRRASDSVVGQIQRYMGYVKQEMVNNGEKVKGIIIALDDDQRIRRALSVTQNIEFYRYQVIFKLFKAEEL